MLLQSSVICRDEDHKEYCYNNRYVLLLMHEPMFVLLWYLDIFLYA